MPARTAPFDAANYLRTDEARAEYLNATIEDGSPEEIVQAIADVVRAQNMRAVAEKAKISRPGLYKAIAPAGNPGFGTMVRILEAMGLAVRIAPKKAAYPQ